MKNLEDEVAKNPPAAKKWSFYGGGLHSSKPGLSKVVSFARSSERNWADKEIIYPHNDGDPTTPCEGENGHKPDLDDDGPSFIFTPVPTSPLKDPQKYTPTSPGIRQPSPTATSYSSLPNIPDSNALIGLSWLLVTNQLPPAMWLSFSASLFSVLPIPLLISLYYPLMMK